MFASRAEDALVAWLATRLSSRQTSSPASPLLSVLVVSDSSICGGALVDCLLELPEVGGVLLSRPGPSSRTGTQGGGGGGGTATGRASVPLSEWVRGGGAGGKSGGGGVAGAGGPHDAAFLLLLQPSSRLVDDDDGGEGGDGDGDDDDEGEGEGEGEDEGEGEGGDGDGEDEDEDEGEGEGGDGDGDGDFPGGSSRRRRRRPGREEVVRAALRACRPGAPVLCALHHHQISRRGPHSPPSPILPRPETAAAAAPRPEPLPSSIGGIASLVRSALWRARRRTSRSAAGERLSSPCPAAAAASTSAAGARATRGQSIQPPAAAGYLEKESAAVAALLGAMHGDMRSLGGGRTGPSMEGAGWALDIDAVAHLRPSAYDDDRSLQLTRAPPGHSTSASRGGGSGGVGTADGRGGADQVVGSAGADNAEGEDGAEALASGSPRSSSSSSSSGSTGSASALLSAGRAWTAFPTESAAERALLSSLASALGLGPHSAFMLVSSPLVDRVARRDICRSVHAASLCNVAPPPAPNASGKEEKKKKKKKKSSKKEDGEERTKEPAAYGAGGEDAALAAAAAGAGAAGAAPPAAVLPPSDAPMVMEIATAAAAFDLASAFGAVDPHHSSAMPPSAVVARTIGGGRPLLAEFVLHLPLCVSCVAAPSLVAEGTADDDAGLRATETSRLVSVLLARPAGAGPPPPRVVGQSRRRGAIYRDRAVGGAGGLIWIPDAPLAAVEGDDGDGQVEGLEEAGEAERHESGWHVGGSPATLAAQPPSSSTSSLFFNRGLAAWLQQRDHWRSRPQGFALRSRMARGDDNGDEDDDDNDKDDGHGDDNDEDDDDEDDEDEDDFEAVVEVLTHDMEPPGPEPLSRPLGLRYVLDLFEDAWEEGSWLDFEEKEDAGPSGPDIGWG